MGFTHIYINNNDYNLKYVKFENLPEENNKEIYTQLCKYALIENQIMQLFINSQNLPESIQELNNSKGSVRKVILNYFPTTSNNQGLSM